jgi:hypothetical protein
MRGMMLFRQSLDSTMSTFGCSFHGTSILRAAIPIYICFKIEQVPNHIQPSMLNGYFQAFVRQFLQAEHLRLLHTA